MLSWGRSLFLSRYGIPHPHFTQHIAFHKNIQVLVSTSLSNLTPLSVKLSEVPY